MLWAAYACGGVALLLGLIRVFIWCSQNLNFRQWVIATAAALLMPIALIAGLRWMEPAGHPPAAEEADAAGLPDVPEVVDAATVALMTEALSQTRSGYTSETLMQVPRGGGGMPGDLKYKDLIFRDSTGDGASIDLTSMEDERLVLAATARNGARRELVLPLGRGGVPTDRNISLAVQAGNRPAGAYMRALVDGKEVAARGFPDAIDFGDRDWRSVVAGSGRMTGVKVVSGHRFVAPWALSNPKLAELVASTRAELRAFFAGDDTLLYPPLGAGPIGPSPLAGTFMLPTLPPE
jgi:hypothetical protein